MPRRSNLPQPGDLLTPNEVCAEYKVSRSTVYRWARSGLIAMYKVGGSTRFDRNEIDANVLRQVV